MLIKILTFVFYINEILTLQTIQFQIRYEILIRHAKCGDIFNLTIN